MADALQTKRIDFLLKPEPDIVDEPWLLRSPTTKIEQVRFGHLVLSVRDDAYFDLMNNFKLGVSLIFTFLTTMFIALLIGVCIRRLAYLVRFGASRTPKLFRGYFTDQTSGFFPALLIFTLFVSQFLWFTTLFLTNNIKVEV